MSKVSEPLMERTWQRVGASSGTEIVALQKRHQKAQYDLSIFVYVALEDLREEAASLGIYIFHVVLESFLNADLKLKRVKKSAIARAWGDWDGFSWNNAREIIKSSREPHILQYAHEALTEDDSDVVLSEHELEHMFKLMGIAADCLHNAAKIK